MHLAADYIHPTPHGGSCRVRIYLPDEEDEAIGDAPVVICSDLPTNKGMSVTNAAELIAAEVIKYHKSCPPLCGSSTGWSKLCTAPRRALPW